MPVTDQCRYAEVVYKAGSSTTLTTGNGMIGLRKSISALNALTPYVPGVYRCNPVTISTTSTNSKSCPRITEIHTTGSTPHSIEGDVAAIYAYVTGDTPSSGRFSVAWSDPISQFATNKAYAKLMSSDLEVGTMLGELQETLRGLRSPLLALRKYVRSAQLRLGDTAAVVGDTWLEWRFGIRPLLKTIQDIYDHVNTELTRFDGKMRKRGGKTQKKTSNTEGSADVTFGQFRVTIRKCVTRTSWYSAKVAFRYTRPLTWQERYGLDASDLPGIAWELTRLSFIVDRYLAIGQWLSALKASSSAVQVLGLALSQRSSVQAEYSVSKCIFLAPVARAINGVSSTFTVSCETLQRKCSTPSVSSLVPGINNNSLSLAQRIDELTLAYQGIRR